MAFLQRFGANSDFPGFREVYGTTLIRKRHCTISAQKYRDAQHHVESHRCRQTHVGFSLFWMMYLFVVQYPSFHSFFLLVTRVMFVAQRLLLYFYGSCQLHYASNTSQIFVHRISTSSYLCPKTCKNMVANFTPITSEPLMYLLLKSHPFFQNLRIFRTRYCLVTPTFVLSF